MEWQKVWDSLVASGPLAGVLAFAVWKLWGRYDQIQEDRIRDLKDLLTNSKSDD